jgi:hypothetical protein
MNSHLSYELGIGGTSAGDGEELVSAISDLYATAKRLEMRGGGPEALQAKNLIDAACLKITRLIPSAARRDAMLEVEVPEW